MPPVVAPGLLGRREGEEQAVAPPPEPPAAERRRVSSLALGAAGLALLAVPLLVALAVLRTPRWFPLLDMAQTELRVRDVGSADPPLIGLGGRIGTFGDQGSHPGPLSFWSLAPFYRLTGASAWSMQVGAVALHLLAMAGALWVAARRGGPRLVLAVVALLAVLTRAYGAPALTEPWNPYLPVLWWLLFLLALWSVAEDDWPVLPVAVFAGTFCMQTHISYVGLVGGLLAAGLLAAGWRYGVRRRRPVAGRWLAIAAGVGVVLWLPPLIEQLTTDTGNLSRLFEYFGTPPDDPIGLRRGVEILLVHLDPSRLLPGTRLPERWPSGGSALPGLVLLAAWAASVAVARRLRHATLLRLDAVLAVALVLGAVTTSRIFGFIWFYLSLWAGSLVVLLLLAIGWTAVVELQRRLDDRSGRRLAGGGQAALVGVAVAAVVAFTSGATDVRTPEARLAGVLADLVGPAADALEGAEGEGAEGPYLVTWTDALHIGSQGFGLVNELERDGFDVGAVGYHRAGVTPSRILEPADAELQVHLSVGADVELWTGQAGVQELARIEPRSEAERAEYDRLGERVAEGLRAAGQDELAANLDENLFVVAHDPSTPRALDPLTSRMLELGLPAAVFLAPATFTPAG